MAQQVVNFSVSPGGTVECSRVNRIAFVFLWIFIFCVPWEEEASIAGGIAFSRLFGAAAGIICILACLSKGRIHKPDPLHYVMAAFFAWAGLSYYWSVAPELSLVRIISYAQLFLMVWLIWEFASSDERQTSLFAAYILGTYVSALGTIYSFVTLRGREEFEYGRYSAAGFNENELGITLALSLVMSCYLLARNKGWRLIWLVHIPLCILAICLTGSRGAFIASAVALLIFPLSFASFSKTQKKVGLLALLVLTAVAAAVVPQTTWDRVATIRTEVTEGTLTKRTYIWAAGLDVYREHPFGGVGAGAFGASVYSRLDIPYVAHNSFLSVLVELGAVGAILFTVLLIGFFRSAAVLPSLERRVWTILLLTWSVAVFSTTWEHRKPTWFLFALLIAQADVLRNRRSISAHSLHTRIPLSCPLDHADLLHL